MGKNMSKRTISLRLSLKQKAIVKNFLGRASSAVDIPSVMGPILKYGIVPSGGPKANMIMLTAEQKRLLKKEFNVSCDYIELTKEMSFR